MMIVVVKINFIVDKVNYKVGLFIIERQKLQFGFEVIIVDVILVVIGLFIIENYLVFDYG